MSTTINFEDLKSEIEIATKLAFKENVEKYGTDICAFSLPILFLRTTTKLVDDVVSHHHFI